MAGEAAIPGGFLAGGTPYANILGVITPARVAWGTVSLSSGIGTVGFGFPIAFALPIALGANIGAGTVSGAQFDPSLYSSGSVIVRGLLGTAAAGGGGTIGVLAFGG
jgi:hypothetical protein